MSVIHSQRFLYFAIAYSLFIIYGSLVPLNYHPKPFDEAWLAFSQIRYLNLGAGNRADWIANIILYIPLSFSLASAFLNKGKTSSLRNLLVIPLILIFCMALAISIEYYQQFFPPRTVSLNDLLAETIGSVIGLLLWFGFARRLQTIHTHISYGGRQALLASAILYTLAYLAISFFPFDFVTSLEELQNKLTGGNDAWLLSAACGGFIFCNIKLILEIVLVIPLGIFLSVLWKQHPRRTTAIILSGLLLGIIIETVQLFLLSGIAQGASIITRTLGLGLGALTYTKIHSLDKPLSLIDFKKYLLIAVIPYLLAVAHLNGWTLASQSISFAIQDKLANINFLPFYYHYYTTEAVALTSLLSIFAMYLPIGLGVWLWHDKKTIAARRSTASLLALGLCFMMETGKLFIIGKHPDPTNLLISYASAFLTYSAADFIYQWFRQSKNSLETGPQDTPLSPPLQKAEVRETAAFTIAQAFAVIIVTLLLSKTSDYPGSSMALISLLLGYGIIFWKYPSAWLIVIPALIPIADLSPWTGRLYFSELDYFILLTLAISLWQSHWATPRHIIKPAALFLIALYSLLTLISVIQGLFPWQAIDSNSFNNYYSAYNSLRVAKGFFWAILLLPLLAYNQKHKDNSRCFFIYGILIGLTFTTLAGLWERYIFTGLFDYTSDYRLTSTFYSMHTGGAHLDAYLLLTMPFIIALFIQSNKLLTRFIIVPLLFTLSLYILLVTYSRGAYIAFVIASIVMLGSLLLTARKSNKHHWKKRLWLPLFFIIITLLATPVLNGTFMQQRFKQSAAEADFRSNHWLNAIKIMDQDILSTLFGMGSGSFPGVYLWRNTAGQTPTTFTIKQEQKRHYLQLGSGSPFYIEQSIKLQPFTDYQLKLDYRTGSDNSRLSISICEKAIQHSFTCKPVILIPEKVSSQWQTFAITINTQIIGDNLRPTKLILHNSSPTTSIDISNIRLTAGHKNNLIKNADFAKVMDHWFFSADEHIPWRAENLWVQRIFDQGWLGLISFSLLLLYSIIILIRQLQKQDYYAAITLSALSGFLVIGVIDSPLDAPNIALLFFLIMFIALLRSKKVK